MQRDDALRQQLADRLAAWPRHAPSEDGLKRAAVALAITDEGPGSGLWGLHKSGEWSTQAALILTKRAAHLRRHAGQWALPGGRIDNDETPEETALRELAEEVGLQLAPCPSFVAQALVLTRRKTSPKVLRSLFCDTRCLRRVWLQTGRPLAVARHST